MFSMPPRKLERSPSGDLFRHRLDNILDRRHGLTPTMRRELKRRGAIEDMKEAYRRWSDT